MKSKWHIEYLGDKHWQATCGDMKFIRNSHDKLRTAIKQRVFYDTKPRPDPTEYAVTYEFPDKEVNDGTS